MGVKTLYEYFYKLAYGDRGLTEHGKYVDNLDVADAEIKANKDARHTHTSVTTFTSANTITVAQEGLILVSASSPYTLILPTPVNNAGLIYKIKKTDFNYNLITMATVAGQFHYENADSALKNTYPRLNTGGAKATFVSDGTNWQVINEELGQVPECSIYLSANQLNITAIATVYVEFNAKLYDIGNNYDISTWVSGNATSTSAGHLVDSGGAFTAEMVGKRVKNTTDTTYTYVTVYNSATDLTVRDDIFIDTEGYEIKQNKYVCPISGMYSVAEQLLFPYNTVMADKAYIIKVRKNLNAVLETSVHSSSIYALNCKTSRLLALAKDDVIQGAVYSGASTNTVDVAGAANYTSYLQIELISKD